MLRMVRVTDKFGKVLHTYPIDYNFMGDEPSEIDFIIEARKAAEEDKLVSVDDLRTLRFDVLPG